MSENNAQCLRAQATLVSNLDTELDDDLSERPKPFSKHISRDQDGKLIKSTRARITRARAQRIKFDNLRELAQQILDAPSHVAMVHGICEPEDAEIVTKHMLATADVRDGKVARDKAGFTWPTGAAVLQLDYDPEDGKPPLTPDEWLKIIYETCPELRGVQIMIVPSVSAYIYDELTDEELQGPGGFRAYAILDKGSESRRVGVSIAIRLFEAGHGYIKFGRDGKAHPRTVIDVAVFSPERPNFIGAASTDPGLTQRKPAPVFTKGKPVLCVADVPDKGDYAAFLKRSPVIAALKGKHAPEERERRQAYVIRRAKETGIPAEKWLEATQTGKLPRNLYIEFANGRGAALAEIEANPEPYRDQYCADPHEPEEGTSRAIARIRASGQVLIYSFLHGGCEYRVASFAEDLVERIAIEGSGVAFGDDMLAALARMQRDDMPAWQSLREDLKTQRIVKLADLEKSIKTESRRLAEVSGERGEQSDADLMVQLGEQARYFRSPTDDLYADVPIRGHIETVSVEGSGFKNWLIATFHAETQRATGHDTVPNAVATIIARMRAEELPTRELALRVRRDGDAIYYDLCDPERRIIAITEHGWSVTAKLPDTFRFIRASTMAPAPMPISGDVDHKHLRALLNVRTPDDYALLLGWLLNALSGRGPYIALVVTGEPGSAKSSMVSFLQMIVDPSAITLGNPTFGQDLYLNGTKRHVIAFDNISKVKDK